MAAPTRTDVIEVTCSLCDATIPINMHTRITYTEPRTALHLHSTIVARLDLADLYAHAWSHTGEHTGSVDLKDA